MPPGFPSEDDFEALVCFKCVEANPWIKAYAGTEGFLPAVFRQSSSAPQPSQPQTVIVENERPSLKRKASDEGEHFPPPSPTKRVKEEAVAVSGETSTNPIADNSASKVDLTPAHKHTQLPHPPSEMLSLMLKANFRDQFCHCPACYPRLIPHPILLDDESVYEPSLSSASSANGDATHHSTRSAGSRSLLDRGEAALNNVDRVRAIEGVMVYNHLRDKVKDFLRPYAESGKAVSAEDIKAYFEGLRGDSEGMKEAQEKVQGEGGGEGEGDSRREQSGY